MWLLLLLILVAFAAAAWNRLRVVDDVVRPRTRRHADRTGDGGPVFLYAGASGVDAGCGDGGGGGSSCCGGGDCG